MTREYDNPTLYEPAGMRPQCTFIVHFHSCRLNAGHPGMHSPGRLRARSTPAEPLDVERLAKRILASFWFSRRQAIRPDDHDESSCSMCSGHGGYHQYDVSWHEADCPIRWACRVLGTTDALGKANDIRDELASRSPHNGEAD